MSPNGWSWQEPPFHQLMTYVFSNYSTLDQPCNLDCNDCKKSCPDCHIARYQGWKGGRPRYECPNIKSVYLQRNLAAHVAQTKAVINKTVLASLGAHRKVKAASLGGGPGIECIALADILNANGCEGCEELAFRNFDIEDSWRQYFTDLTSKLDPLLENLSFDPRFIRRNFLKRSTDARYHVVFVPWVLSEVGANAIPTFADHAISACENGGHVVVLERRETDLGSTIIEAFENTGKSARVFGAEDEVQGHCGISFPQVIGDQFKPKFNYQSSYYVFQRV